MKHIASSQEIQAVCLQITEFRLNWEEVELTLQDSTDASARNPLAFWFFSERKALIVVRIWASE